MPVAEVALVRALPWLIVGLFGALLFRILRGRFARLPRVKLFIVHLSAMTLLGLIVTLQLLPLTSPNWFQGFGLPPTLRLIASGLSVAMLLTAGTGVVAIASSGAVGYRPSLSYLQLLSAVDAVFATSGLTIGVTWLAGPLAGVLAGLGIGAVCVWSIWYYLRQVGLDERGGWKVDKRALWRYVYPYDLAALVLVLASMTAGAWLRLGS